MPTTTDYAMVSQSLISRSDASIGTMQLAKERLLEGIQGKGYDLPELLSAYEAAAKRKLEEVIDQMKTSADDVPVLLVGGGAVIISPDRQGKVSLKGASRVIIPEYAGVANAIGAGKALVLHQDLSYRLTIFK